MLMFLASVLDQTDLALEHIQNGSVHDARVGLAAGMSGFRNGPEIPERPGGRRIPEIISAWRPGTDLPIYAAGLHLRSRDTHVDIR